MVEHLFAGERGGMNGPFNVTLRSPEMGDLAQKLGAQLRFHSSLSNRLNEMAILMTARFWNAQYEWSSHHKNALAAGLSPEERRRIRHKHALVSIGHSMVIYIPRQLIGQFKELRLCETY